MADENKPVPPTKPRKTPRRARRGSEDKKTPRRRASPKNEKEPPKEPEKEAQETKKPVADEELRCSYLQRIYRQLQSTHPNQDDAVLRQAAATLEMQFAKKATSQDEYVAGLDQEIHKLMQAEMVQANNPPQEEAQSLGGMNAVAQPQVASDVQTERQNQMSQSRHFEYAQALAKAQAQSDTGASMGSAPQANDSFQTMMASRDANYGYDTMQQQDTASQGMGMQMGNQYYTTVTSMPASSAAYSAPGSTGDLSGYSTPRNMMEAQQQLGGFQTQQYSPQPAAMRPQQRSSTLQEFTAHVQHLDKSVLIELLWNQRNALAQWQCRATELERQLSAHRSAVNSMRSAGMNSPYSSPMVSGSPYVSPNAAEAELQRARDRSNARQQPAQYSYGQQYGEASPASAQNGASGRTWSTNPQLYWEKIRLLKAMHAGQLHVAHRALSHHNAPPNSVHSIKAQSVKDNILLVLSILNETPKTIQPRPFETLSSIERFIQATVIPIVRKVQSSGLLSPTKSGYQTMVSSAGAPTIGTQAVITPSANAYPPGVTNNVYSGSSMQYPGTQWSSPSPQFNSGGAAPQYPRGVSVGNATQKVEESSNSTDVAAPVQAVDENLQPNRSRMEGESTKSERQQTIPVIQEGSYQEAGEETQRRAYGNTTPPDATSGSSLRASGSSRQPGAMSDAVSGDTGKDVGKMMETPSVEDSLNDFSDFPELDFEDQLPSSNFVKENSASNAARKRGYADV